jgi:hypothetical protein
MMDKFILSRKGITMWTLGWILALLAFILLLSLFLTPAKDIILGVFDAL